MEKVVIIGSGSAGLAAAVYCGRASLSPLVISGYEEGGQLMLTTAVENYPGFPDGVQGPELMLQMRAQAEKFGARFVSAKATSFERIGNSFKIGLDSGKAVEAFSVIIASGASARFLGIPGERELLGHGVSTCATCDAFFYKGKEVAVVGGGDSACEEAGVLAKVASRVTIIHRRNALRASKIMQERMRANPKISFAWETVVEEAAGKGKLSHLVLKNVRTGERSELRVDGMFLAIGHVPNTEIFKGILEMDENGFLRTDKFSRASLPGVFAAGNVADPRYRQAIVAAGEGCKAALEAEKYLAEKGIA